MLEKAYVLEGSATLTADDAAAHGPPVTISAKDMVTFPKVGRGGGTCRFSGARCSRARMASLAGTPARLWPALTARRLAAHAYSLLTCVRAQGWRGRWDLHSFLKKRYAFFDGKGLRVDEDEDEEDETAAHPKGSNAGEAAAAPIAAPAAAVSDAPAADDAPAAEDAPHAAEPKPCSVCAAANPEDASTCAQCGATVCDECQVNDSAIDYCDRCKESVCADCGTVAHCSECSTGICASCGDVDDDDVCDRCRGNGSSDGEGDDAE
jgi:hypothetical protein